MDVVKLDGCNHCGGYLAENYGEDELLCMQCGRRYSNYVVIKLKKRGKIRNTKMAKFNNNVES